MKFPKNKILICGLNSPDKYSGGRYHSWLMTKALELSNYDTYYFTNNKPLFLDDLNILSKNNSKLKILLWDDKNTLSRLLNTKFDLIIIIPDHSSNFTFYSNIILLSRLHNSKICLLNFETPNWINKESPFKRNIDDWKYWKEVSPYASLILSSTKISSDFAKKFFINLKNTNFTHCYPSINSICADSKDQKYIRRGKRIIWIGRMENSRHKGSYDLEKIITKKMSGYTFVLIIGAGNIPNDLLKSLKILSIKFNIKLIIKEVLSDKLKFKEIKKAKLVLFPSQFEGFGLPPIEALYCKTPCIAFDIPVLRETCGDNLIYAKKGDFKDFKRKIEIFLTKPYVFKTVPTNINDIGSFENYSKRLNNILSNYV